jgi:hypothetical protein
VRIEFMCADNGIELENNTPTVLIARGEGRTKHWYIAQAYPFRKEAVGWNLDKTSAKVRVPLFETELVAEDSEHMFVAGAKVGSYLSELMPKENMTRERMVVLFLLQETSRKAWFGVIIESDE